MICSVAQAQTRVSVPHRAAVEVLCVMPHDQGQCGTDTLVCAWCLDIATREKSGRRRSRRENRSPRVHPWDRHAYRFVSPPWRARESVLSPVKTGSPDRATLNPPAESWGLRFLRRLRRRCTDTLVCARCLDIATREKKSGRRRSRRENRSPRVHPWDRHAYRFVSPPWRARESFLSPVKTGSPDRATLNPPAESWGLGFLRRLRRRCTDTLVCACASRHD